MAQLVTVARPYARAAFEVAKATDSVSAWLASLNDLALLMANEDLHAYVTNPKVTPEQAHSLFKDILGDALTETQSRFVSVLAEARQLVLLADVAALFTKAALAAEQTLTVEVTSAKELTAAQQQKLAAALEQRLQQKIELKYDVSPDLMGGVVIRTDEWVIDGSVKEKLAQLKKTLVG